MDAFIVSDVPKPFDVEVKQDIEFALGSIEVLGGKGVDREPWNVQFKHPIKHPFELLFSDAMAQSCGEVAAPCKASISVHDDGEVVHLERMFHHLAFEFGFDRLTEHISHAF